MNQHLAQLAKEFKSTKFLKIVSDQCIPNYPDRNVPTLLVYGEGDIKANLVGAVTFGGMNMTVSSKLTDLDWVSLTSNKIGKGIRAQLAQAGAVPPEVKEDRSEGQKKSIYRSSATAALSSDEDESDDDRGYY